MAMMSSGKQDKKDLNVELNLMPVFDILSVCICFLLMTVVWVQIGVVQTSQAIGGQASADTPEKSSVWLTINEKNDVEFSLRPSGKPRITETVRNSGGVADWAQVQSKISGLGEAAFESAIILPSKETKYELVVQVMDEFKGVGIKDVGISPL